MKMFLIMAFVLSSGSIYCSSKFNKKFEETLPISIFSVILLMYIFSYMGFMQEGVYIILGASFVLYLMSLYEIFFHDNKKIWFKNTFTPAFFIWVFMLLFLFAFHKNRVLTNWDEFSHWGDVVKSMYTINDFSTSANSLSAFKEYPPGLSLFQYFFQVLNGEFKESLLFVAYQIIPISLFLSFVKKSWKNPVNIIVSIVIIMLVPIFFNPEYLKSVYVDSVLAITAGYSFAIIYIDKKDLYFWVKLGMALSVIVLLKDVGKLFVFEALLMVAICCIFNIKKEKLKIDKRLLKYYFKQFLPVIILIGIVLVVMVSWNIQVAMDGVVPNFSGKVDVVEFIKNIFKGGNPQNVTILNNFTHALGTKHIITFSGMELTYFSILGLFVILFFLYYTNSNNKKFFACHYTVIFVFNIIYTIGICVMYIFKFSTYEGLSLASFERYIAIYMIAMLVFISCLILHKQKVRNDTIFLLSILLIGAPIGKYADSYFNKYNDAAIRQPYTEVSNKVTSALKDEKKKIYIISQQSNGFDYWVLKFSVRNNLEYLNVNSSWSLGDPYYEGDIWTKKISPQDWQSELKEEYDLVLLYTCDDKFIATYGEVFSDESTIHSGGIYAVDKETGKLSLFIE